MTTALGAIDNELAKILGLEPAAAVVTEKLRDEKAQAIILDLSFVPRDKN
jgi:hypothetical protein